MLILLAVNGKYTTLFLANMRKSRDQPSSIYHGIGTYSHEPHSSGEVMSLVFTQGPLGRLECKR